MKQKINYKYVCLLMMLITVCLFGCSQTVMAAADDSITCGLSKESRSSAVVQKSRHTSNVKLYKCDGSYWKTIKNTNGRAVFPAVEVSNHQFNWWFIPGPPKGHCYCSPQRAVSQALLLARYKAVLLESSLLDSSACSFIYF